MFKIVSSKNIKEIYEKAFTKGFDAGREVREAHNSSVILAGYNAVKEAEKILREASK